MTPLGNSLQTSILQGVEVGLQPHVRQAGVGSVKFSHFSSKERVPPGIPQLRAQRSAPADRHLTSQPVKSQEMREPCRSRSELITSKNHYVFNLAWLKALPAGPKTR